MNNRLLRLARLLALLFMLLCLLAFMAGIFYFRRFTASQPEEFTLWGWSIQETDNVFNRIGLSFQWWVQWNLVAAIILAIFTCGIGIFIYFRKKDDWFSLYISAALVFFGTFSGFPIAALMANQPALAPVFTPLLPLAWLAIFLIFFMFPNGKFTPRWTRWAAACLVTAYVISIILYGSESPSVPLFLAILIPLGIAPVSQVYRYRKVSDPIQRQQTKWVIFAFLVVFIFVLFGASGLISPGLTDPASPFAPVFGLVGGSTNIVLALIPLSIAFAILRYRLWDVDLLIRKTLVYAFLTGALALLYFGLVTLLQSLSSVFGLQSPVITVISTLAIAALFNPLRIRIQEFIDRRFYRRKYDAEKALAQFAEAARNETDIQCLNEALLEVVQETVQPERVSLWLRKGEVRR